MANLLTAIRLLLVIPVTLAFALPDLLSPLLLILMLVVAVITDYCDGPLARRLGTASPGGMLFDHSTDFIFVTCGLAGAAWAGLLTPLLPMLIVVAFSQYVLDSYFWYRQKRLRMSRLGRLNGIFYFVPLFIIAAARLPLPPELSTVLLDLSRLVAWALLASTLASIADRALAPLKIHTPSQS